MQTMYPDLFEKLLTFVEYSVRPPRFGKVETKVYGTSKVGAVSRIFCLSNLKLVEHGYSIAVKEEKIAPSIKLHR